MTRLFWQIDREGGAIGMHISSSTPREAALKAATRDVREIWLADVSTGKLHVFEGSRRPLMPHEHTAFTRDRNIVAKPTVTKMAYKNLQTSLSPYDVSKLVSEFESLVG